MRTFKHILPAVVLGLYGWAHAAQPAATVQLQIPAQPMRDALNTLAQQTGLQVLFSSEEITEAMKAPAINGTLTPEAALKQLLANTRFSYEFVNPRTVSVRAQKSSELTKPIAATHSIIDTLSDSAESLRIAQVLAEAESVRDVKSQKDKSKQNGIEEMVVERERDKPAPFSTANLDLTRTEDDPLPFITFSARDIQLSGATSLDDFFRNRLAQNFSSRIVEEINSVYVGGANDRVSQINLHGWAGTETVFLLNGRRLAPQYRGTQNDRSEATPNLQGIPLASIERIEILSSAGSAIYGTNATGGIINIITRRDYQGGQLSLSYSTPADVHAPSRGINSTYGMPFPGGMHLRLSGSYDDRQPLQLGDRYVALERMRQLIMERQPERLLSRTNTEPQGATPNIRTAGASATDNLFGPGTANFTTVPDGYTGGGGLSAFTPGTYNVQLAEVGGASTSASKDRYLGAVADNVSFSAGLDKNFSPNWQWSLDYLYSQNNTDVGSYGAVTFANNSSGAVRVPGAATINPFGQDVRVTLIDPGFARPELGGYSKNIDWKVVTTLHGSIGEWRGFWDANYSRNSNTYYYGTFLEPTGGWRNAFMTGAYNPFVDLRVVPAAAPSFYENYVAQELTWFSSTSQYQSTLKMSGPLLNLPAGKLQLTAGVDWLRVQRGASSDYYRYEDGVTGAPRIPFGGFSSLISNSQNRNNRFTFNNDSIYAELSAPLLAGLPLINKLVFDLSGRLDRRLTDGVRGGSDSDPLAGTAFTTTTRSHVYAFALRYDMVEGIAFRASQSIGFKPPSITDLAPPVPPSPSSTVTVLDSRRPSGTLPSTVVLNYTQYISGGNPDLKPETTNSTNFGLIFSPAWVPGFRVSLDYIESVRDDVIAGLSGQQAVDFEADLPQRVTRGPADGHPSGVGPIVFLDLRNINFRQILARGADLSLDQEFKDVFGGRLLLSMAVAKNISFKIQTTNTSPAAEQVRIRTNSTYSQQIAWNGNAQLQWQGRQWGFGWSTRYYDYMLVALSEVTLLGSDRVPWELEHDAHVSYRIAKQNGRGLGDWLSGSSLTLGIRNFFDREPRVGPGGGVAAYDSIAGRSVWLQMRKDF